MFIVQSSAVAIAMCIITMLCWGSWANTQKLATKEWRFQLYYWDYAIGVLLLSLLLAFTLGSKGAAGRSFLSDLRQADIKWLPHRSLRPGMIAINMNKVKAIAPDQRKVEVAVAGGA